MCFVFASLDGWKVSSQQNIVDIFGDSMVMICHGRIREEYVPKKQMQAYKIDLIARETSSRCFAERKGGYRWSFQRQLAIVFVWFVYGELYTNG